MPRSNFKNLPNFKTLIVILAGFMLPTQAISNVVPSNFEVYFSIPANHSPGYQCVIHPDTSAGFSVTIFPLNTNYNQASSCVGYSTSSTTLPMSLDPQPMTLFPLPTSKTIPSTQPIPLGGRIYYDSGYTFGTEAYLDFLASQGKLPAPEPNTYKCIRLTHYINGVPATNINIAYTVPQDSSTLQFTSVSASGFNSGREISQTSAPEQGCPTSSPFGAGHEAGCVHIDCP